MNRTFINPEKLPDWSGMFSQVVTVEKNGLKFIHVSGQVGVDASKSLVGSGNFGEQTMQALINLKFALESAGVRMTDVCKLRIYVVNYESIHASIIREALRDAFVIHRLPALSLIGVAALADERFLIEIDADAIAEV
jgi:enamine deaminase RidA (YjgF/YER057c/UK114 family)